MPNPSARIKLIKAGNMLLPATCAVCGRPGGNGQEEFTDPNIFFEWDQVQVYFCEQCTLEMSMLFGAGPTLQLRQQVRELTARLIESEARAANSEALVDLLTNERIDLRNRLLSFSSSIPIIENVRATEGSPQTNDGESESSDAPQSDITESVNVKGTDDISESSTDHLALDNSALLANLGL